MAASPLSAPKLMSSRSDMNSAQRSSACKCNHTGFLFANGLLVSIQSTLHFITVYSESLMLIHSYTDMLLEVFKYVFPAADVNIYPDTRTRDKTFANEYLL